MSNDWLRSVHITEDTGDADERLSALRAQTVRPASSSPYPVFLDPGIPLSDERDDD